LEKSVKKDTLIDIIASALATIFVVFYTICIMPAFIIDLFRAYSKYLQRAYAAIWFNLRVHKAIEALLSTEQDDDESEHWQVNAW
jgi:hypothetical protein